MPVLDVSELNTVITILGAFIAAYGFLSVKIKQVWYLGEALPAVFVGIILGPIAAKFIDSTRWGSAAEGQQSPITLGMCRIVIGVQLVIAGFQLPARYQLKRWKEMLICLLPVMTIMWLCTTACIMLTIPKLSLLAALVIGSCVTCTDPILSQAVAKGPFSDKYVRRELREIISSEAGANDGFGFPFLLLAVFLIRHADPGGLQFKAAEVIEGNMGAFEGSEAVPFQGAAPIGAAAPGLIPAASAAVAAPLATAVGTSVAPILPGMPESIFKRAVEVQFEEEIGRLGGGVGKAMEMWFVDGWLYIIFMSVAIGAVLGFGSMYAIKFSLRKKWIDGESFLLWPTALGLFTIGVCGLLGTDDLLACFVAGNCLNWNSLYLEESEKRHDEVNSCIDVLLNFGGFMYIGSILPWSAFNQPDITGITYGRLLLLGLLVMVLRRIPAIFITYKLMPNVCKDWKEALFMGYFGPIGIGAVFYVEHTRHLFPETGEARTLEEDNLTAAMIPVVYWLVLFSIVFHGLSIPALDAFYRWKKVPPIVEEEPAEINILSENDALPNNAYVNPKRGSVVIHNRFSRADMRGMSLDFRNPRAPPMPMNLPTDEKLPFDEKKQSVQFGNPF